MTELNQEALEKARQTVAMALDYASRHTHPDQQYDDSLLGLDISFGDLRTIKSALASLPPVDAEPVYRARKHSQKWCDIGEDEVEKLRADGWEIQTLYPAATIIALQGEVQELNKLLADGANGRTLAAEAEVARLKAELAEAHRVTRWAHDTLYEINPANYDHDEVCKLNNASVEVILGLAPILGETHGKSAEWWASRSFRDGQKTGEATAICKSCGQSFPLSAPHDCPGLTAGSQKGASDD